LTREELEEALEELGGLAQSAGKVIDIALYGGSCLMLASNFRVSTADVDAVAQSDQGFIDEAARRIADRRGWPANWLNDGVRTYLSPRARMPAQHELLRAYPGEGQPGLRVFVPVAEYVLAMKLMAMRIDETAGHKDLADILNLLEIVGVRSQEEIVQLTAAFYPEARISGRLKLGIDALWKARDIWVKDRDRHETPRYLGRGGTSR
jgi:hypothetical protein